MQRVLAGIIRHNAAGVNDHALHKSALPKFAPPGDVVSDSIRFCDVRLPPAISSPVPGRIVRRGRTASSPAEHGGSGSDKIASSHASFQLSKFRRYTLARVASRGFQSYSLPYRKTRW